MPQAKETHGLEAARAAKAHALEVFAALAPVVGVGITRIGEVYGLKINLQQAPAIGVKVPDTVDNVPVRVEVVGPIRKH